MPSRIVREGWINSERVNELTPQEEVFFLRLILIVDDFGRFHGNHKLVRSALYPLRDNIRDTDIPRLLAACEKAGLVRCYEVDGKAYLEVFRVGKPRAKHSKFPDPPDPQTSASSCAQTKADESSCAQMRPYSYSYSDSSSYSSAYSDSITPLPPKGEQRVLLPDVPDEPTVPDKPPPGTPKAKKTEPPPSPEFLRWYAAYPLHEARAAAWKAWPGALKAFAASHPDLNPAGAVDELIGITVAYAISPICFDKNFIPQPARWLNERRWEDDRQVWQRTRGDSRKGAGQAAYGHGQITPGDEDPFLRETRR